MKRLTLDTNCLLAVDNREPGHEAVMEILKLHRAGTVTVRVVATTAAENILAESKPFEEFLVLLERTGFDCCEILKPIGKYNITFYDHAVYPSSDDQVLEMKIWEVLFPSTSPAYPDGGPSAAIKVWNNRMCDCQMLQSHIRYDGDVFITRDRNFLKQSKINLLADLGAGVIATPEDFLCSNW